MNAGSSIWMGFLLVIGLLGSGGLLAADAAARPEPTLSPAAVVEAQLAALREGGDDGLARVFNFASPANQSQTGPAERFAQMIREAYPELLGHQSAVLGPAQQVQDTALQAVEIVSRDGLIFHYLFILSRQSVGACLGCWMTDSVYQTPAEDGTAI